MATMMRPAEVDLLERDALELLSFVWSAKNTLVPINKIPPEVFSLVAHHCDEGKDLVTLTHVCHRWREIFVSCPSLWTSLDCRNIDKTHVYLKRSKASPLKIRIKDSFLKDAFHLTIPHLGRFGDFSLSVSSNDFCELTEHLCSPAPLIKTLSFDATDTEQPILRDGVFGGDLSSLRDLSLNGVVADLAWDNMSNLRTLDLLDIPSDEISITQLLHFFERAPLLCKISLWDALPYSSDVPLGRVVALPNLKSLLISAQQSHAILMNHLSIPAGALTTQESYFPDDDTPIPFHLPETLENLKNLSNIASLNLDFDSGIHLRLRGPSGGLTMRCHWFGPGSTAPIDTHCEILLSLHVFSMSEVERLAISHWPHHSRQETIEPSIYRTFLLISNLRTLTLVDCVSPPFITVLNPQGNASGTLVFSKLEELSVYIKNRSRFYGKELLEMAKERASRGAKLKAVTIVCFQELQVPAKEVFKLRAHVSHVEYRLDDVLPEWDAIPGQHE